MPGTWSAHVFILSIRWIVILRIIVVMSPLIPVYSWSKIVEAEVIWFSDVVVFIHCSLLSRLCSASSVTNSSAPKHIQLLCIIYHNMDIAQCLLCFLPWQTSSNTFQSLAFRTNAKSSVRTISVCRWDHIMIDILPEYMLWLPEGTLPPLLHLSFFFPIHLSICSHLLHTEGFASRCMSLVLLAEERERGQKKGH